MEVEDVCARVMWSMNEREDEDGDIREQVMTTTGSSHTYIHTPQLSYTWLKIQAQLDVHAYMMMKMGFFSSLIDFCDRSHS